LSSAIDEVRVTYIERHINIRGNNPHTRDYVIRREFDLFRKATPYNPAALV